MCGIFGAVGFGWNQGTIRALTWANRERGTDSLGYFDSTGKMIKAACDPDEALARENITRWLNESEAGNEKRPASWFIAGHTRLATRGKVNRQNSHPFRYGKIIGCHNGMVDAPKGYVVDSQYLFDSLNKAGGNYNQAWGAISGYWGVAWFDDDAFYLQAHHGEISIGQAADGCYYYSSSKTHLAACIGHNATIHTLAEGQTLRFTVVNGKVVMQEAEKFVSSAAEYWTRKYSGYEWEGTSRYTYKYAKNQRSGVNKDTYYEDSDDKYTPSSNTVRDYDAEWRSAWEEYSSQSEHSQVS